MVDKTHKEVYTYQDGWGWGGGWGWRYYRWGVAWPMTVQRRVETYTDGTVVVNLPVGNPVRATKQIDGAVAKLFTKYPPQSSGA